MGKNKNKRLLIVVDREYFELMEEKSELFDDILDHDGHLHITEVSFKKKKKLDKNMSKLSHEALDWVPFTPPDTPPGDNDD